MNLKKNLKIELNEHHENLRGRNMYKEPPTIHIVLYVHNTCGNKD